MGRQPKQPNQQLADLVAEARLSRKGLARRVVERGSAVGVELAYDHTSVGRWLAGEQPNPPGPELIAEVLTEVTGRRVTAADCGMVAGQAAADIGLEFSLSIAEATTAATTLWRSDVERRRFLVGASYAVAVYPAASMRWLTMPGPEHPASGQGYRRIGQTDVDAVRTMTAAFRDLDNRVGGGKVRPTIVQYLHSSVAPLLQSSYPEPIGRQLFATAAELTKLAGWAAYDLEEHGLAQRYLIQALRLSRAAGDAGLGAEILAAMSHQATYVGRPGDAVDLARAAQIAARTAGLAVLESECHMVEAHGHAARADGAMCATSLNAAERAYDRAGSTRPPWLDYFDGAYLSAKTAHCFRDLGDAARTAQFAEESLNMSDGYTRGRAFNLCLLASARADEDPLEAVRIGGEALALAAGLESRRSLAYLREVRHRLAAHANLPDVAEFRHRVLEVATRAD
ncbi:hypothetical protein [Nocardia sp. NPDC057353]|uniref:hypothetical protein n=1 Tax=Nocardia sp. NPDC057353 TaxID=3346104 RepID=UPI00362BB34C